ncbi:hypothetical protein COT99_01080 [Candidatus Falkowbacteria bacterium CG10_big_fil_rev_8_21_14_0_10_43_10]|uniref:Uncharacterized protein n=1 Tax=Candidatus Falkowbacteria bacterium CG10_big_fil_rev_8_21_14_0_10_43_10 TaxID=1974567 RepID=A0A2H0V2S5_9BACT|nr:MAG: hypothetical protein COT99_01080 [Candidatus Falkowbacteria bacterium CG10_big_fil_rev_8_21_14_0_10_43_10]
MTNARAQTVYVWSWKKFAQDFLELYGQKTKKQKKQPNVFASVIVAFIIIFIAAQILGAVNNFIENKYLLEKYKGANVVVYSNIG